MVLPAALNCIADTGAVCCLIAVLPQGGLQHASSVAGCSHHWFVG